MNVTEEMISGYLNRWQNILRLRDWDISIKVVGKEWKKSGDIKIDQSNRMAVLMINQKPVCTNLEEIVIHELLHLKLWAMDQMIEHLLNLVYGTKEEDTKRSFAYNQFMETLEATTEDLTKGFLAASGSDQLPSFDRLQKEVDKELKNTK